MITAYRITKAKYAKTLEASGRANRWNIQGQFVLYTAASRALAILELLAHRNAIMNGVAYKIVELSFDDKAVTSPTKKLAKDWFKLANMHKMQEVGSHWYGKNKSLVLKVPSVIVKEEFNYVINTRHPDFSMVRIIKTKDFDWDKRLL